MYKLLVTFFYNPSDNTPYKEVVVRTYGDGFELCVVVVAGHEDGASVVDFNLFYGVFSVYETYGLAAVPRFQGTVDDEDVALVHIRIHHGHPVHLEKEGGRGVAHQELYKVQLFADIFRGRGESGLYRAKHIALEGVFYGEWFHYAS